MRRHTRTRWQGAALLVGLLCGSCAVTGERPTAADELLEADRDFARLSEETDPKQAFAAYLAPNALLLPRGGPPVEGYEAAIATFGDGAGFKLHWQPQHAEAAASGELGWTWGTYQVIVDSQEVSRGKYVNIWARQPDGRWKVRMDMGNQEPAQQSPDENP